MAKFSIYSFKSGINQAFDDSLINTYEASIAKNCDISRGTLRTKPNPAVVKAIGADIKSLIAYYNNDNGTAYAVYGGKVESLAGNSIISGLTNNNLDYVNFYYQDKNIAVFTNGSDPVKYYDGSAVKNILNRRAIYDEDTGELTGYADANGNEFQNESQITTLAPKGKFVELHYDRLWIGGVAGEPDRVYFSTANRYGSDIHDFTAPIEENEANQHGGFIDFSSYDGGKVIGMKVLQDDIYIFKEKTMFKIFGTDPSNYTKVQIFSSNGAIANKSIVAAGTNLFFLNHNNIYVFDGVNVNPIGDKIHNILKRMNQSYAENSSGIYFNDKYYLAVPLDNSTKNNCLIEYDMQTNGFMIYDLECSDFLEFNKKLYFCNTTGVHSLSDNGVGYMPLLWESPMIERDKNVRKIFDYLYAVCVGSCKITLITDRAEKSIIFDSTKLRKKLKNKGKIFKIRIESIDSDTPFELSTPEWIYEEDID